MGSNLDRSRHHGLNRMPLMNTIDTTFLLTPDNEFTTQYSIISIHATQKTTTFHDNHNQ